MSCYECGCPETCGAAEVDRLKAEVVRVVGLVDEQTGHSVALQRLIETLAHGEVPKASDKAPFHSQVAVRAAAKLVAAKAERDQWKAENEARRALLVELRYEYAELPAYWRKRIDDLLGVKP